MVFVLHLNENKHIIMYRIKRLIELAKDKGFTCISKYCYMKNLEYFLYINQNKYIIMCQIN